MDDTKLRTRGVEAVDKALRVLGLFKDGAPELSLNEISQRSGIVKSSALRLLVSLRLAGYVTMTPDKRYRIGVEVFRLGQVYRQTFKLEHVVRPALATLVAETGESGSFYHREGGKRVCLFREDTKQVLREHIAEGESVDIGRGAAGRVLTTFEQESGGHPASKKIIAKLPFISLGERDPDIAGLSAPVFAAEHGLVGALAVSGPRTRFTAKKISVMAPILVRTAAYLTNELGGQFYGTLGRDVLSETA